MNELVCVTRRLETGLTLCELVLPVFDRASGPARPVAACGKARDPGCHYNEVMAS